MDIVERLLSLFLGAFCSVIGLRRGTVLGSLGVTLQALWKCSALFQPSTFRGEEWKTIPFRWLLGSWLFFWRAVDIFHCPPCTWMSISTHADCILAHVWSASHPSLVARNNYWKGFIVQFYWFAFRLAWASLSIGPLKLFWAKCCCHEGHSLQRTAGLDPERNFAP